MANRDKGRKKWGEFLQDNTKSGKDKSMGIRGGGNRASQPLYRPGSGPLRKSGRSMDDLDNENMSQENPKPSSIQHRLKQSQINSSNQTLNSLPSSQVEHVTEKLNDLNINYRSTAHIEQAQGSSQNSNLGDSRKKVKKPEQQLYVPKKVKEALAEQDISNRSSNQGVWDRDQDRDHSEDRDSHSNRSYKSDSHRNRSGGRGSRDIDNGGRGRDGPGKRYSGNRRNRHGDENEERWRSDSPLSNRSFGNRKDNSREVRQGSEPLFATMNHVNDFNRTRETRSVEPAGHPEKFQGKPPSGKWGGPKDSLPKNMKIEHLPPRLQKKYLIDNGLPLPVSNSSPSEDTWNGSSIIFQGSSTHNYPPAMQHSQTMQNLPLSGPLPPQPNWSNTVPARSRGRGRLRPEEIESSTNIFRCVTPDQYSAPSSRSHTPSQEYMQRSYDRRGSNSTMYTSMESLSRADSSVMPPASSVSPITLTSSANKRQTSPDSYRRGVSPPSTFHRTQTQRQSNNAPELNIAQEKKNSPQNLDVSPSKTESVNRGVHRSANYIIDWNEEAESDEKVEAERTSRSSSVLSLRENSNVPGNENTTSGHSRRKKKKRERRHPADRSNSRDKARVNSRDRQNNQQNRENDNFNNNQKNTNNSRRHDHRRHRNIIQRSRESSKDRNYRGSSRNFDDLYRHRRQTPNVSSHSASLSNTTLNLTSHQTSPSGYSNSQPPGVLVLPETNQSPPSHSGSRPQGAQQQRTLFNHNNPDKPIVVPSPSSRAVVQREGETSSQSSNVPVFQSHGGITSPHHSFQGTHLDSVPPPYMTNDQFGNTRPSWYDPYSDSFRSAKNHYLLLDIERADLELQWILSSGGFTSKWERVLYIRHFLQESLKTLLETDIKFCQSENVEQHFWKILFYNMIEMLRKGMPKESSEGREQYKKIMLKIIDEGTVYLESLLTVLESKYEFKLDMFLASSTLPKGLGILGLALVSAQKIYLFLGDLARYREQANETNNYGKSRQWYLKAQQLNPKNGRPYNQLALLAHYARRKLDAVYYYMRSLMASNPFHSARESLIALFDENRKKYESTERKRKEEREWKERARMKEKEGANSVGGGLRREIWIHPGGRRVRRTTTAGTANEARLSHSDLEELAQLNSVEVNKRFVTSYLHVHGKLITKIGMETFQEAGVQMLKEFRALLQHSPLPLPGSRLLQLLALNMFAIESTQLKDLVLPTYVQRPTRASLLV
ncbi:PREDICTED: telomerase-binding protein EST1A-like [Dufourea novaeangliae]|uniref:telomerase-binding protein EST1A-like n=1 Tax=Dufourea novaeangliae TaxID=178035 RepID=UPI00076724BD|nr:PREDICTED: telomerase-binding protein EST1A-like [Dufourea novaeangliae]